MHINRGIAPSSLTSDLIKYTFEYRIYVYTPFFAWKSAKRIQTRRNVFFWPLLHNLVYICCEVTQNVSFLCSSNAEQVYAGLSRTTPRRNWKSQARKTSAHLPRTTCACIFCVHDWSQAAFLFHVTSLFYTHFLPINNARSTFHPLHRAVSRFDVCATTARPRIDESFDTEINFRAAHAHPLKKSTTAHYAFCRQVSLWTRSPTRPPSSARTWP